MNINEKSEALGGKVTIRTIISSFLLWSNDGVGPLNPDEERSLICRCMCTCVCAYTHTMKSQQAGVFLLWECETSPSHLLVPGGNGTEHFANQLQLSPLGLKVSPPTGMIYSQVESENRILCSLFLRLCDWARGSCQRRESETKIMIYNVNLDFTFLSFVISTEMKQQWAADKVMWRELHRNASHICFYNLD